MLRKETMQNVITATDVAAFNGQTIKRPIKPELTQLPAEFVRLINRTLADWRFVHMQPDEIYLARAHMEAGDDAIYTAIMIANRRVDRYQGTSR
jgi:hypothetical protein